ncbi:MAG TPA: Hsp20 family protein [Spirochaetota bacterium]|nr:Hsp20 family protein [Spirochaetota bacterium]HPH02323.1 Hsp20 family protein [Spirochaetota bacterium]
MTNEVATRTTNDQETSRLRRVSMPVDIRETPEAFLLTAEIPGATRDSVTIELEHDELTIEARADLQGTGRAIISEFSPTIWSRSFHVGRLVDRDQIEARVENGLLHLRLAKAKDARPQRIEIKTA